MILTVSLLGSITLDLANIKVLGRFLGITF